MRASSSSRHRSALRPVVVVLGAIILFIYGVVALLSQDPRWFRSRVEVPDPERIVIRVDGEATELTSTAPDYAPLLNATRRALSGFANWAPGTVGLSDATLTEYQSQGVILELYFDEPVDFQMPFPDGKPTALIMPIQGRLGGEGYVFRGRNGRWWAGQLTMSDPQPLYDILSALGYVAN
jgi:hypothetical protein